MEMKGKRRTAASIAGPHGRAAEAAQGMHNGTERHRVEGPWRETPPADYEDGAHLMPVKTSACRHIACLKVDPQ
jgi:hypothetical protein